MIRKKIKIARIVSAITTPVLIACLLATIISGFALSPRSIPPIMSFALIVSFSFCLCASVAVHAVAVAYEKKEMKLLTATEKLNFVKDEQNKVAKIACIILAGGIAVGMLTSVTMSCRNDAYIERTEFLAEFSREKSDLEDIIYSYDASSAEMLDAYVRGSKLNARLKNAQEYVLKHYPETGGYDMAVLYTYPVPVEYVVPTTMYDSQE